MAAIRIPVLMPRKRVLIIGDESIALFIQSSTSTMELECSLPWNLPNFNETLIEKLISNHQGCPVSILLDIVDQHYRTNQVLPKANIFDRPKILKRNLRMAFPSYPVRASLELKTKNRSAPKTYMFAALAETERLSQIADILFQAEAPVGGISLLPIESAELVKDLSNKLFIGEKHAQWSVLISPHQTGGLRQIVTKDNELVLTRITPQSDVNDEASYFVEDVLREFKATLSYITRFGYKEEEGLNVTIICNAKEKSALLNSGFPVPGFKCINIKEAGRLIKVDFNLQNDTYADIIHAAIFARKLTPVLNLPFSELQRISRTRQGVRVASIALIFCSLAFTGLVAQNFIQLQELEQIYLAKQNQENLLTREHEQETRNFDALPVKPSTVKGSIAVKQLLDKNAIMPDVLLNKIKLVLREQIILDSFKMKHTVGEKLSGTPKSVTFKPGDIGKNKRPVDKESGEIEVSFSFALLTGTTLEDKILFTENTLKKLELAFPNHDVELTRNFEDLTNSGESDGLIGEVDIIAAPTPQNNGLEEKQDTADVTITGAPIWSN